VKLPFIKLSGLQSVTTGVGCGVGRRFEVCWQEKLAIVV
jgi:hypothetical protein